MIAVFAIDPSLTATGWVSVEFHDFLGTINITAKGVIKTEKNPALTSFEDSAARADVIFRAVRDVLHRLPPHDMHIMETPAVHGHRTDASLISGIAARCAVQAEVAVGTEILMVAAQRWQRHVVGWPNPSKAEIKAAVLARCGVKLVEATADAAGIAIWANDNATVPV